MSQFDPEELAKLLEPQAHTTTPPDDLDLKLSLLNYILFMGCSQDMYEAVSSSVVVLVNLLD